MGILRGTRLDSRRYVDVPSMLWSFMTAKRLDNRAAFVAVALLAAISTAADAQYDGKAWRLPPSGSGGARGVQAQPQPQVLVLPPSVHHRTVFPRRTVFPQQSAVVWVPAVVLADGRVFANFGYGYEQVFRSCSGAVVVGQPAVIGGNGVVLSPHAATYTQPVPNQQTSSQQMASGFHGQNFVVSPAYSTCFGRNASGGVIVYRF